MKKEHRKKVSLNKITITKLDNSSKFKIKGGSESRTLPAILYTKNECNTADECP